MASRLRHTMNMLNGTGPQGAAKRNDMNIPPSRRAPTEDDRNNNASQLSNNFGPRPLRLDPTLPLPDPHLGGIQAPWLLSMEHLQDFCNKSTAIYCNGNLEHDFTPMFDFIFEQWLQLDPAAHGDIHKLDIEFAGFFAKLVGLMDPETTTQQILNIHEALIDASAAAHRTGFLKKVNWQYTRDHCFIGGQQVEFFKIKHLLHALIIIIDKRVYKPNPVTGEDRDFTKQEVRLVRTGLTARLSQPISFDGLTIIDKINENEVVTTLSEAIRFIMALERREGTLLERTDEKVLDYWLGLPKEQLRHNCRETSDNCGGIWTGEEKYIPVGPSTKWWKKELVCKDEHPGLTEEILKRRNERKEADRREMEARMEAYENRQ